MLSVEGAALVAFDGSPGHPDLAALMWRISAEEGVTHLGPAPKYAQRFHLMDSACVFISMFPERVVCLDVRSVGGI